MRKKLFFVLAVCWMLVIFLFSAREAALSTQDSTSAGLLFGRLLVPGFNRMDASEQTAFAKKAEHPIRKTAHAAEYAVLGFFFAGSYADRKRKRTAAVGVPFLMGVLYAVSDEVHQLFVPGRSGQVTDVCIDSFGVLTGTLVFLLLLRITERKQNEQQKP